MTCAALMPTLFEPDYFFKVDFVCLGSPGKIYPKPKKSLIENPRNNHVANLVHLLLEKQWHQIPHLPLLQHEGQDALSIGQTRSKINFWPPKTA